MWGCPFPGESPFLKNEYKDIFVILIVLYLKEEGIPVKFEKMIRYFFYALVLFGFLLTSQHVIKGFRNMAAMTYNTYPLIYVTIFSAMLMGALIGLETLLREAGKRGKWKVNAEKLLFLGLPSLYFTFKSFIPLPVFLRASTPPFLPQINPETISIAAIVFGYALSTSFYKKI
ncbi:MAG: hypothetical protein C4554_02630 [Dethiobacter sp.]|nr:MAG: hypothetical protein C4554_02630 [Dethiobacter sp.]